MLKTTKRINVEIKSKFKMEGNKMKPNILIVMTDQQRADIRKSRGFKLDTMPFLDEWSKTGVDFQKAYTPNPICVAARISMFTGRYSQSHRAKSSNNIDDVLYTQDLLDVLKSQGYITALCGKNHSHHKLTDFDFADAYGHMGKVDISKEPKEVADFNAYLKSTKFVLGENPSPYGVEMQHPYRIVSSALKFIDSVKEDKPFFTWVSFPEPHNPYQVPKPYFDMFPPCDLPKCTSFETAQKAKKGERFTALYNAFSKVYGDDYENKILRSRSNYYGMLRLIDDQFKRLIDGLKERNLEKNTIIIYLSDHGEFVGEYGLMRKGADLSNLLCNVPMIWHGYNVKELGRNNTDFVSIVDILPTFCDILNIDNPIGVQGKSILPLLQGEKGYEKEYECALTESGFSGQYWNDNDPLTYQEEGAYKNDMKSFDCLNTWSQCGQVRSLIYKQYRIQIDMMGNGYLYDLKNDPVELNNLWDNEDFVNVKMEMQQKLLEMMLKNCDIFPLPHKRYRVKIHPKGFWYQNYICTDTEIRNYKPLPNLEK